METIVVIVVAAIGVFTILWLALASLTIYRQLNEARQSVADLRHQLIEVTFNNSILKAKNKGLEREIQQEIEEARHLIQALSELHAYPLRGLNEDTLIATIRKELEDRIVLQVLQTGALPDHRLSSKVGGAAFRVTDKVRRGKFTLDKIQGGSDE